MSQLTQRDTQHIFQQLRSGLVPERGIDAFAVGIDAQRRELRRQLDFTAQGEGAVRYLRGGYGCGKTFIARLALHEAQARGFATSFVVVSDNDLRFHKFDEVYRKVVSELGTKTCPRGALGDILDRWISKVEDAMIGAGEDADAPGFDDAVHARLEAELAALTGGKAPADFVRVVQTVFRLKNQGDHAGAGALISWLSGSSNVSAAAKRVAGIKGDIGSNDALEYLHGVLEIVKASGYTGLVVVIDEAETILRMRKDLRHKSLNGIRQIADASGAYAGLLWMITGTPEFFDTRYGVAGLAPLHDRIYFKDSGDFVDLRQPQLQLRPFDAERLRQVALKLRAIYPIDDRDRLEARVSDAFIERLIADVTTGFKGDVGVVPRHFLRDLVSQLDLVDQHEGYDPMAQYQFTTPTLTPEEQAALRGVEGLPADEADQLVPAQDNW